MAPQIVRALTIAMTLCVLAGGMYATAAFADDAARISHLESEIQQLRTRVAEQDRRIQRLEARLDQQGAVPVPDFKPGRRTESAPVDGAAAAGPFPWESPKAWKRIVIGMTEAEVAQILGEPTAVETVDNYKTLFYSDAGTGGNSINGHVNLKDDVVVAIKRPASRQDRP